ncbi:unnamed protein product [Effrenium voratum]|nr:unnamed protein product [Effrenium voratum]
MLAAYQPHCVATNHIQSINMQRLELEPGQPLLFTWVLESQSAAAGMFQACQEQLKKGEEPYIMHTPQVVYEGTFNLEEQPTPKLMAYSPSWWPAYDDWPKKNLHITGNWKIPKEVQEEAALKGGTLFDAGGQHQVCTDFINGGEKPVYIGLALIFGYSAFGLWQLYLAGEHKGRDTSVGQPQGSVEVIHVLPSSSASCLLSCALDAGGDFEGIGKPVLLKGAARSDEYLIERYGDTPLDQATRSDTVAGPTSSASAGCTPQTSESGDEFPCEHEESRSPKAPRSGSFRHPSSQSMAAAFWDGSDLASAVSHVDNSSNAMARAAMLVPISMDSFSLDKDPGYPGCAVSLRRGIIGLIIVFVLATCAGMYHALESSTTAIRSEAIDSCNAALGIQKSTVGGLVFDNVTSETVSRMLGSLSNTIYDSIQSPADRGLESIWGSLRTLRVLNDTWDGGIEEFRSQILYRIWVELDTQWGIKDGPFGSQKMPVSELVPPKNQLESLSIIGLSGESVGMAGSSYTVSCPRAGPAICGSCRGHCRHLDLYAFSSSSGTDNVTKRINRNIDTATGLPVGEPLLVENFKWKEVPGFQVQQNLAQEIPDGRPVRSWSKIHAGAGTMRMSWTSPISYCGSYSCFDGVIAADVVLDQLSAQCTSELKSFSDALQKEYNFHINAGNSSVFVVQHVSHFPEQHGLLLGSTERGPAGRRSTELEAPEQALVAATSKAILAKFGAWDAPELLEPQQLTFRKSEALKGRYAHCGWRFGNNMVSVDAGGDPDCLQVGTKSLKLGERTRWLMVAVLPESSFNAKAYATERLAVSELMLMGDSTQLGINEARISASLIFFAIGFICVCIGALLSWAVSDPLQHLSMNMHRLGGFEWTLPEFCVLHSGGPCIKDVAAFQRAFRKLLCGIRAFSHFIPEEVVTRIVYGDDRRATRPHVDKRCVTIMFTGIRDFATMRLSEDRMLKVITRFHTIMTSIVEQYHGSVGEILDEGLLVYWNASNSVPDHAAAACEAGLAQRKAMSLLREELADAGWLGQDLQLRLSVGIHTGEVLCGCIGSNMKMKFGCIGDAMNLASRLQGLCKFYDVDVMCSEETFSKTHSLVCRKIDHLQVKGRQETTAVFEVMGRDNLGCSPPCDEPGPAAQKSAYWTSDSSVSMDLPEDLRNPGLRLPDFRTARKKGPLTFSDVGPDPSPEPKTGPQLPQLLTSRYGCRNHSYDSTPSVAIMGRSQPLSPEDRTTPGDRTTAGDRSSRTYGGGATSTAASASHYWAIPSPSPAGSRGFRYYVSPTSSGWPSSTLSPRAHLMCDQVTQEQKEVAHLYEAALEAYQSARFPECVELCEVLLTQKPDDTATQKLLGKAKHPGGQPEVTVMREK